MEDLNNLHNISSNKKEKIIDFKNIDYILLTILFCIAFYLYTIPFQNNPSPFGEGDSAWHFANADYMVTQDESLQVDELPEYIHFWYYKYGFDTGTTKGALQYPPSANLLQSMFQIWSNDRFVAYRIETAIMIFLAIFSVYFLLYKLYKNTLVSSLASFGLIFSVRAHLPYLFGQQATYTSIIFFPLVIYFTVTFFDSVFDGNPNNYHLYILVLLLLFHLIGILPSLIFIILYFIYSLIIHKNKSHFFAFIKSKSTFTNVIILLLILAFFIVPISKIYTGAFATEYLSTSNPVSGTFNISRLLTWSIESKDSAFQFTNFNEVYPGTIFAILLFLGIVALFVRRSKSDKIILIWGGALYLFFHLDMIGVGVGRISRLLDLEVYLFMSIAVLGLFGLISLIKIEQSKKRLLDFAIAIFFVILVITTTAKSSFIRMDNAYPGVARLTQSQLNACDWMKSSQIEKDAIVFDIGTISYAKVRWKLAACQRFVQQYTPEQIQVIQDNKIPITSTYIMFDYSDFKLMGNMNAINQLTSTEKSFLNQTNNQFPLYNDGDIKVYKLVNQ